MTKRAPSPTVDTEETDTALSAALMELPDGGVEATIWRVNPNRPSDMDYLTRIPAGDFSLESVKREFGGGRYLVRFHDEKGRFIGNTRRFTISDLFKPSTPEPAAPPPAPAVTPELAELRATVQRLEAQLAERERPIDRDPFDIALKIMQLVQPHAPAATTGLAGSEIVSLLRQGMELGRESAANEVPAVSDPMVEMVKAASPLLGAVAESIQSENMFKRTRAALPNPQPAVASAPQEAAAESGPTLPSWLAKVRPYLGYIVQLARHGKNPELYAEVVLDQLPGPVQGELQQAAQAEDFVPRTVAVLTQVPDLAAYGQWLTDFLTAIREQFTDEDPADEPEVETATG